MHEVILVATHIYLYLEPRYALAVVTSRDGTAWRSQSSAIARDRARNILRQQGSTKQFIRARVDTPSDIFLKSFGQQSSLMIQKRTLEEAKLQENDEFQLLIKELYAFIGLLITR